jgi:UDP-2,3-diacylglucosamine hydrolase
VPTPAPLPRFAELNAPPAWRTLEFISDLHLQAADPATFEAWRGYMGSCSADALFILGDLFEVWIGDDLLEQPGFAADCAAVLQATARRLPVFLMHGNRDFLMSGGLMRNCGATLLEDPTVLTFAGRRWLLTHGDALCVSDTKYMQFRAVVRSPAWQSDFLSKTLVERQAMGRQARAESEARRGEGTAPDYGVVDDALARAWLDAADAVTMIHGHTHQPREHDLGGGRERVVLTDWDLQASPPRREVLRVNAGGYARVAL